MAKVGDFHGDPKVSALPKDVDQPNATLDTDGEPRRYIRRKPQRNRATLDNPWLMAEDTGA